MQTSKTGKYYEMLEEKSFALFIKRLFDIVVSLFGLIALSPLFLGIFIAMKITDKGPVFFAGNRIGKNMKPFKILKFRTMIVDADKKGLAITTGSDPRITKIGHFLRKTKIDELPQLINILFGKMSFVGTRPEAPNYVENYTEDMISTLLLRPGLTSLASIIYRDENSVLDGSDDPEKDYIEKILPIKMDYNYEYFNHINIFYDIKIMLKTVFKK